jgi:hypothetical protein
MPEWLLRASTPLEQLSFIWNSHLNEVVRRVAEHPRAFEPGSRQHILRGGSLTPGYSLGPRTRKPGTNSDEPPVV